MDIEETFKNAPGKAPKAKHEGASATEEQGQTGSQLNNLNNSKSEEGDSNFYLGMTTIEDLKKYIEKNKLGIRVLSKHTFEDVVEMIEEVLKEDESSPATETKEEEKFPPVKKEETKTTKGASNRIAEMKKRLEKEKNQ